MKKQLLYLFILTLSLQANAQELFRPSGMTGSSSAHKKFMLSKKTEATKRATTWKVPVFVVQLIASVQSGAGTASGYNFGQVLPHPGITKYSKFAAVDNDGLLTCVKTSRGIEAIALALNIIKYNNNNTFKTSKEYMEAIFGPGGDLESMAKEAEKAYNVYTAKTISLYVEPAEVVTAPSPEPTVSISETKVEIEQVEAATATSGDLKVTTAEDTKITESVEVTEIVEGDKVTDIVDIKEEVSQTDITAISDGNTESVEVDQATKMQETEVVLTTEATTKAEQEAALKEAQLRASMAAEQELLDAQKAAEIGRMNSEMDRSDGNAAAKEQGRLEAEKRKSEIEKAARILEEERIARAEIDKLKKEPKKVVIDDKAFEELSGDSFFTEEEEVKPKKKKRRVGFGFKAGVNASKLLVKVDDIELSDEDDFKFGGMGGVVVDFPIVNGLSIETGAQFSMKGSKYDGSNNSLIRTLNYVQVPVHLKTIVNPGSSSFFFQGGPYFGYAINGSSESTVSGGDKETNDINIGSGDGDFIKALDVGVGAGLGVQFGAFQVGLTYDLGLANLSNVTENGVVIKNRVAGVFVGYRL